ncbi:MAG: sulfatase-like hydrolase/transferase [Alphaproteobacteria bacterium]
MADATNLIFILSDNHGADALGCYGHPLVKTPNLDRIASSGARFENAYCASPLCCPARASLATGRYPHQTGYWDNAIVYDGRVESWMHRLRDWGHTVVSIGKLHFRSSDDDNGFSDEIEPMHILDGKGGVAMLLRGSGEEPPAVGQWELYVERSGIGGTGYQDYDRKITGLAVDWLRTYGRAHEPGWVLFVSYPSPHPPFQVPKRLFDLYPPERIALPPDCRPERRPTHPAVEHLRRIMGTREMTDDSVLRRVAAGYFGLVTHLDEQIGEVLAAADHLGLLGTTRVLYTSDHGELFGAHGLFGKSNMYEGALRIPLMISGPGIPRGRTVRQIVSHVDLFPTLVEAMGGVPSRSGDNEPPGVSLWPAIDGEEADRPGFAEYHATGTISGSFMVRRGAMKLVHHVGMAPQLFDLAADPEETSDLAQDERQAESIARLEAALREICSPEEVDARAKADQRAKVAFWGGRERVLQSGALVFTPPPGAEAEVEGLGQAGQGDG